MGASFCVAGSKKRVYKGEDIDNLTLTTA